MSAIEILVVVSHRITARKHEGDDSASWAVFLDDLLVVTGLTKSEVPYYSRLVALAVVEREAR